MSYLLSLKRDLLLVEVEFLTFKDVTTDRTTRKSKIPISTTRLTRTRRNGSIDTTRGNLLKDFLGDLKVLSSGIELLDDVSALTLESLRIGNVGILVLTLDGVVLLEPGLERSRFDGNDATLDESLSSDELIVGGVVDDINNTGLGRHSYGEGRSERERRKRTRVGRGHGAPTEMEERRTFTGPAEATGIETDGTVLDVATTASSQVNSLFTKLGGRGLSAHFVLTLLDVDDGLSTSHSTLMTRVTTNT